MILHAHWKNTFSKKRKELLSAKFIRGNRNPLISVIPCAPSQIADAPSHNKYTISNAIDAKFAILIKKNANTKYTNPNNKYAVLWVSDSVSEWVSCSGQLKTVFKMKIFHPKWNPSHKIVGGQGLRVALFALGHMVHIVVTAVRNLVSQSW